MAYINRPSRGQQRDKPFRDALRMEALELEKGVVTEHPPGSLRWNAQQLLLRGDTATVREIADRLDGKPAQMLEHNDPDSNPRRLTKIIHEFVHVTEPPADLSIDDGRDEPLLIEANGSGGLNEDTARTKR